MFMPTKTSLLPQTDSATHCVSQNLANCCITMYEQLVQVMELEGYSRPTYNKFVHSATNRLAVVDVIDKLTFYEFLLRLKCRNYSRDPDHAYSSVSQLSRGKYFTLPTRIKNLKCLYFTGIIVKNTLQFKTSFVRTTVAESRN